MNRNRSMSLKIDCGKCLIVVAMSDFIAFTYRTINMMVMISVIRKNTADKLSRMILGMNLLWHESSQCAMIAAVVCCSDLQKKLIAVDNHNAFQTFVVHDIGYKHCIDSSQSR